MDIPAETYLKFPKPIEDLIGKKEKTKKSMRDVELEEIKEYAAEDADITFQLATVFIELERRQRNF
jgi:DNA polymerase-1